MHALFRRVVLLLGLHIDLRHALNVHPQLFRRLFPVAEGHDGRHLQRGGKGQSLFDLVAVGKGQPAGVDVQLRQLEDKILHHVPGVDARVDVPGGHKEQIVRCTDEELLVARGAFQCRLRVLVQHDQLRGDLRNKAGAGLFIVGAKLGECLVRHLLSAKGANGLAVLDHSTVIHSSISFPKLVLLRSDSLCLFLEKGRTSAGSCLSAPSRGIRSPRQGGGRAFLQPISFFRSPRRSLHRLQNRVRQRFQLNGLVLPQRGGETEPLVEHRHVLQLVVDEFLHEVAGLHRP